MIAIKPKKVIILLLSIILILEAYGQDLSKIGKEKPLTVDGGISLNQILNESDLPSDYRDPYAYTIMANLNFSVYGWSIPLSFVYSNQNWSYQQPFNQFSLHPSYKWVQTHIGYSSMSFSPYTLSGYQFLGGGVDLTPDSKWKFSMMSGRLQKRVLPDSAGNFTPAFYRYGSGFKTEYAFDRGSAGLSIFYARDDKSSIRGYKNDSIGVLPTENYAMSVNSNFRIVTNLTLGIEYGTSLFTNDVNAPSTNTSYFIMPFYSKRTSSRQYHAVKSNITYGSNFGAFGFGYERVDPGYNTLGAYYMTNDFVNYTINYAGNLFESKVSLALSTGLQKDNLDGNKAQETQRLVNNFSVGYSPVQQLSFNATYSNFSNYTNVRSAFDKINNTSPYGNLDTLSYTQLSENIGFSANYLTGTEFKQNIMCNINYQKASEMQSDNPLHSSNHFYNGSAGYNIMLSKIALNLGLMFNYNRNEAAPNTIQTLGPTLIARKSFLEKTLSANTSFSYNRTIFDSKLQSLVYIMRAGSSYNIKKKHNIDISTIYAFRKNVLKSAETNEVTITLTYRYTFSIWKKTQDKKASEGQGTI